MRKFTLISLIIFLAIMTMPLYEFIHKKIEENELDNIAIEITDTVKCSPNSLGISAIPVKIINNSSRTTDFIKWSIAAHYKGHSSYDTNAWEGGDTDVILKPGYSISLCSSTYSSVYDEPYDPAGHDYELRLETVSWRDNAKSDN